MKESPNTNGYAIIETTDTVRIRHQVTCLGPMTIQQAHGEFRRSLRMPGTIRVRAMRLPTKQKFGPELCGDITNEEINMVGWIVGINENGEPMDTHPYSSREILRLISIHESFA